MLKQRSYYVGIGQLNLPHHDHKTTTITFPAIYNRLPRFCTDPGNT